MFKRLPAYNPPDALLTALAVKMNDGKAPLNDVKDSDVAFDNETMPAGYIYFGQFVDHDMTLDKTPLTQQKQDPRAMVNFDTPKFDLGSVYGKGPTGSPELYDPAKPGYLLVNPHDELFDLPRDGVGAAYLGDPRNDENLIVAQLHVVFLRMHNKLRDAGKTFEQAQQQLRWTYQYLIVNDFLPRIVGQDVVNSLIRRRGTGPIQFTGKLYQPRNVNKPYMPVEYSGAAYRFGHSMIRAEYEVQDGHTVPIFGQDGYEDLRGNRQIPPSLWIDWNYFFEIPGMNTPDDRNMARLIDTQLRCRCQAAVDGRRPDGGGDRRAGRTQPAARQAAGPARRPGRRHRDGDHAATNAQLGLTEPGWKSKAPLWFYILKESELLGGKKLGPVGGRIVAEVILGLLAWTRPRTSPPTPRSCRAPNYKMGDFILAADAIDPRARIVTPEEPEDPNAPEEPGGAPEEPELPEEEARAAGRRGARGRGRGPAPLAPPS